MNAVFFKYLLNIYPPYWGTGIYVESISRDFKEIVVRMAFRGYNRNYMNTHFGGSLYAMTDPFYALMLIRTLGKDYVVWDKAATIEFIKPGRKTVTARFAIDDAFVESVRENTKDGQKYLPTLTVDITNEKNEVVAKIHKTVYIRKKKRT